MDDTVLEINQSINAVNYMGRANFNVADNSCTSFWQDSGDVCPCSVAVDTLNSEIAAFNTDETLKTQTLQDEIDDLLTQFIAKNDPNMVVGLTVNSQTREAAANILIANVTPDAFVASQPSAQTTKCTSSTASASTQGNITNLVGQHNTLDQTIFDLE